MILINNVNLIVNTIAEISTSNEKKAKALAVLARSNADFNIINFIHKDKIIKKITLQGNPTGIINVPM